MGRSTSFKTMMARPRLQYLGQDAPAPPPPRPPSPRQLRDADGGCRCRGLCVPLCSFASLRVMPNTTGHQLHSTTAQIYVNTTVTWYTHSSTCISYDRGIIEVKWRYNSILCTDCRLCMIPRTSPGRQYTCMHACNHTYLRYRAAAFDLAGSSLGVEYPINR